MEVYAQDGGVVRRYAARLSADPALIDRASLREGGRIVQLAPQGGVGLDVLDLSTANTTGTFKSWMVCLAVAQCLRKGSPLVLTQSSGNTANAVAAYAAHAGLRAVVLHPPASRRRIVPELAEADGVQFVEVDAAEDEIKTAMVACSEASGVPIAPAREDMYEGHKLRAHFLADAARELGRQWDWHVQAVSSGYGPLGHYRGLREVLRSDPGGVRVPRFLGVQQEAVAPYVDALTGGGRETGADRPVPAVLEPTLFRRALTDELVAEMREVCAFSRGTVRRLANTRYLQLEPRAVTLLTEAGVSVARDDAGAPWERAGLYALAGTLAAIEEGLIRPGERALAVFTGGSAPAPPRTYEPHWLADRTDAEEVTTRALDKLRP
ncbi:pyridoxal-phosphate dependent enzyme [Streptomyces sp. NPDC032472]|uniref:pyridoxal-phosphate dependent enzyme n=1 Tax=Streptomyces sp. NPDC032472 TaxID=3155018 RepID=UPI0033D3A04E